MLCFNAAQKNQVREYLPAVNADGHGSVPHSESSVAVAAISTGMSAVADGSKSDSVTANGVNVAPVLPPSLRFDLPGSNWWDIATTAGAEFHIADGGFTNIQVCLFLFDRSK
jgi:hypothetical protein